MKLRGIKTKSEPTIHSPQAGQHYLHKRDQEVYVVSSAGDGDEDFALISISDGNRWFSWASDIGDIFDGDDEDFELIQPGTELTFTK